MHLSHRQKESPVPDGLSMHLLRGTIMVTALSVHSLKIHIHNSESHHSKSISAHLVQLLMEPEPNHDHGVEPFP